MTATFKPGMPCVVLSVKADENPYGDDHAGYVYPQRYHHHFAPLHAGQQMLALIYEPRRGGGRVSYVAWGLLSSPPEQLSTGGQQGQWRVSYDGGLIPLPRTVQQEEDEHVFEQWLRDIPKNLRPISQRGKSVRPLNFEDFYAILAAARATPQVQNQENAPERKRMITERLIRNRGFRLQVLSGYNWRCAVTGWSTTPEISVATGLLDAAHLKAVSRGGSDSISNGMALTPTVHRLFDAGLISFERTDHLWRVKRERDFGQLNLEGSGGELRLDDGQPLIMPDDRRFWPTETRFRASD